MATKRGEVSILAAVEQLEAKTVRERTEGLEALRHILGQDRSHNRIDELGDDSFHNILESVFDIVKSEKAKYVRASTKTSQSTASSRLASAGSALRVIIEAVGNRLKHKTASAVLDHVVDTLPNVEGGFCSPIQTDYLKAFSILLSHKSRGEHLRQKQWLTYADFILDNISDALADASDIDGVSTSPEQMAESRTGISMSLRISQSSAGRAQRLISGSRRDELSLEDLLIALKYLIGTNNAPLLTKLRGVMETAILWLDRMSRQEEAAFEVLNTCFATALSEDVTLAARTFHDLSRIIRQRGLWTKKSVALRENILASMILCRSLFLSRDVIDSILSQSSVEQLLHTIRSDYEKLSDRDRLQIEDLGFAAANRSSFISMGGIGLATETSRGINTWAALSVMAPLLIAVASNGGQPDNDNDQESLPKRRKLQSALDDLFQAATRTGVYGQVVAIQICIFVLDQQKLLSVSAINHLSQMNLTEMEDEPAVASWICLLLARIIDLDHVQAEFSLDFWKRIWLWASRLSNVGATSRPACYLLHSMTKAKSLAVILSSKLLCESIFPDGVAGPSSLTDAALLLLTGVMTGGLLDTEKTFKHFASHTLRWLDHQWTISSVPDRQHNAQMALFAGADYLYPVLMSSIGVHVSLAPVSPLPAASSISRALLVEQQELSFTSYMLSEVTTPPAHHISGISGRSAYLPVSHILASLKHMLSDLLSNKIRAFFDACKESGLERSSLVNLDVIEITSTACVLCHSMVKDLSTEKDRSILEGSVQPVWEIVCSFLLSQSKDNFPRAFSKVASTLTVTKLRDFREQIELSTRRATLSTRLCDLVEEHAESQGVISGLDQEFMNSLESRASQSSHQRLSQTSCEVDRSDLVISYGVQTLFARQCFLLKIDQALAQSELDPEASLGTVITDVIVSLDPDHLLASKDFIVGFLNGDIVFTRNESFRLLERLAQICLQDTEFARCEAALCLCLRALTRLTPLWVTDLDDDLANVGYDVYQWFINTALGKGIASQRVLLAIAALMDSVLRCNSSYGIDSLPSARTSLLQILNVSHTSTKHQLVGYLSNLFNGYVLSQHPAVFNDIIDNLPSNPDQREGIVLRLYIIACLGSQWHTILRQSIYYIFETAANVPSTTKIAAKCVLMISEKLNLSSSEQVLVLFCPQVFYTWLEQQHMESIPYAAFGYESLTALQKDVQGELVAQLAMRSSSDSIQKLVHSLGTPWNGLLERWFAKIVAYTILYDMTIQRSAREVGKSEMVLITHLGEEVYAKLCRKHFAQAISTVLLRLSDDRGFERGISQETEQGEHAEIYNLICTRSSSQTELPPGQQPSIRAKHLIPILDRLCTRAQETLETAWTPALLTHVYRTLLADAKSAFGPLHTCAILRKIRIVLCLAGPVALSGYPLQMILHALRPFLTQFHSSQDAFGIFWYLLEHGREDLKHKLSFVTGLSVAIFASLSRFACSSQESTTQESHFAFTMSKAQEFRTWLGEYLQEFSAREMKGNAASTFIDVVKAAKQITKSGSSAKATSEGSLLYHLLADQASDHPLLSRNFFRLTLRSLCDEFTASDDFQDDILYDDDDVLKIAPVLLSVMKYDSWQDSFRIWISQALGRAYALQGPRLIKVGDDDDTSISSSKKSDVLVEDSYQSIVNILGDLLWHENRGTASAAEATLQSICSALPAENKSIVLGESVDQSVFDALRFVDVPCPSISTETLERTPSTDVPDQKHDGDGWASGIIRLLCKQLENDPVLSFLPAFIIAVPSVAPTILPHVMHLALHFEADKEQKTKVVLSQTISNVFDPGQGFSKTHIQLALKCITHLRRCRLPTEPTMAERNSWLTVDFGAAASAALDCGMYRMALLMLEIHVSQHSLAPGRSSRRSSHNDMDNIGVTLSQTYRHVDDPDFFYGTQEESDLSSIVEKLCHEGYGYKALSFQSALFDSNIRTGGINSALEKTGSTTLSALNLANLNGLSSSIGSILASEPKADNVEHSLQSLMNLHQWDVAQDRTTSNHGTAVLSALRTLSSAFDRRSIMAAVDKSTLRLTQCFLGRGEQQNQQIDHWTSLAVLAELKETMSASSGEDLDTIFQKRSSQRAWTEQEGFDCIEPILLGRETTFATVTNNAQLRKLVGLSAPQAILLEIKALRSSLSLGHVHEMSQFCLNRAAYLSELLPLASELGVKVEAAIKYDLANTFWAQHETGASIRILQYLHERELPDQAIQVQKAEILTDLGSKISEARLDRPDEVTAKYLVPAIEALGKDRVGAKVGRVFHNFAAFCDSQLREPDNVEEYERVEKIRDRKLQEVRELETMYKKADSKLRDTVKAHYNKAKTWLKLDEEELHRLKAHRERLVRNCLENYLLSLRACEDYPNDVLRFLALWMEQSASVSANSSVSKHLSSVPTHKFAPLMNQLSSRILSEESPFQSLLSDLMYHICEDHPFHSLYQIFATSKSKGAHKDEIANSRHAAATKLSDKVMKRSSAGNLWISIHNSNIQFVRVAQEKMSDKEHKTGSKFLLRNLPQGAKLEQTIHDMHNKIPPPTMKVDIRPSKDYSSVPTIAKFDPQISIAGGVSVPKILTIIATDGSRHKMLLKGGNDDLRQDSIMEQVFEQVSNLLKDHRPTRQRKLGIRTYKVIPLTHNAGIIEFVRDTMPLHDYVLPAHTRYYPKDYKPNRCRKEIQDAQSKSLNSRLLAYRNVVAHFHPVMRFFFMEHFLDPDDWFQKRLNYSRSTAAISMLGHVLGLGDRHGHNILLDTKTGEAVHIDLGIAFEAGRVLPVPEVVPFRLTRDLVDGMGLSGVEGVFRRCCNFTLEALRRNQEAIMTILDVLRWDPLYSWSVSPLRLARMQENQEQAANNAAETNATNTSANDVGVSTTAIAGSSTTRAAVTAAVAGADAVRKDKGNNNMNEPSEADRALAVVSKKLGKSLSVEATVNELIRQAMDERNLAVLYCGWAAYA